MRQAAGQESSSSRVGRAGLALTHACRSAIRPSASVTTRSQRAASASSWVMMTSVAPVSARRANSSSMISCAGRRVEVAGRLVGEDQRRARRGGAGDGDALLLAARKLRRVMGQPVAEADRFELGRGAGPGVGLAGQLERGGDVLLRGHRRQQVEGLQHDADAAAAGAGERVLVERLEIGAGDVDRAAARALEPGQHRHQRALARARGAEQRERLAGGDGEVDAAEDLHRRVAFAESEPEIARGDSGRTCHRARDGIGIAGRTRRLA